MALSHSICLTVQTVNNQISIDILVSYRDTLWDHEEFYNRALNHLYPRGWTTSSGSRWYRYSEYIDILSWSTQRIFWVTFWLRRVSYHQVGCQHCSCPVEMLWYSWPGGPPQWAPGDNYFRRYVKYFDNTKHNYCMSYKCEGQVLHTEY